MHGLMENAIYGGRVDNTFDMRVMTSYLLQYFSNSVVTGQVPLTPPPCTLHMSLVHPLMYAHLIQMYCSSLFSVYTQVNQSPFSHQVVSSVKGGVKSLPFGSLPVSHHRRDYISLISSLPDTDSPALFGLPANIEQSQQRTISSQVSYTLSYRMDGLYT